MENFVILDIDLALIFSRVVFQNELKTLNENQFIISCIKYNDMYIITKRKNFDFFIKKLKELNFTIIVWSAGEETYVKQIIDILFANIPISYLLTGNHIKESKTKNSKDLQVIQKYVKNFIPENSVLIDDTSFNNIDNKTSKYIEIPKMTEKNDDELINVIKELEKIFQ